MTTFLSCVFILNGFFAIIWNSSNFINVLIKMACTGISLFAFVYILIEQGILPNGGM